MPIPAALFNRRRGRESGTSARYSVGRPGGGTPLVARSGVLFQRGSLAAGSSVMARTRSRAGRILLRRRPLSSCREDRISALPDELLLVILRRLDSRTALGTGVLSRRWAHLPRELPALDLRVGDALPPRYHRWVRLYHDICPLGAPPFYRRDAVTRELLPSIKRYERRAMRAFTASVESFLEQGRRRRVNRMRLEFFVTGNADGMNRLIEEAIDSWGVEDLEAVAKPTFNIRDEFHSFPSHGLCREPRASRLRSLKLAGCFLPPLHEYHRTLTVLVLENIPRSTPEAAYQSIFTSCLQLQTLHLISCGCSTDLGLAVTLVVDAPSSEIRELVVENCTYLRLRLRALPLLERVKSESNVFFEPDSFPCLRERNISLRLGLQEELGLTQSKLKLDGFLVWTPDITSLIISFTGPYRWIVPSSSPCAFLPNLTRLLVADVPSSWDVTWPCLLLERAPSLETLHIHIAPCNLEPGEEIHWPPTKKLVHHRLSEFVVAGFRGTARQIDLVRFVLGACTMLRHVSMFKNGYARDKGRWDWEMATQQQFWTDDEKENTLKQIMDGVPSSTTVPVELVLG